MLFRSGSGEGQRWRRQSRRHVAKQRQAKSAKVATDDTPTNVLAAAEWQRVDAAVERALTWMASQQQEDGSFPTLEPGQPGVTSLCMMAFMSHGHAPATANSDRAWNGRPILSWPAKKKTDCSRKSAIDAPRFPANWTKPSGHMHGLQPRNFFAAAERVVRHERAATGRANGKEPSKKRSPPR